MTDILKVEIFIMTDNFNQIWEVIFFNYKELEQGTCLPISVHFCI